MDPLTTTIHHALLHARKDPKTVTEIIDHTTFNVVTETHLLTATETIYINKTVISTLVATQTKNITQIVSAAPITITNTRVSGTACPSLDAARPVTVAAHQPQGLSAASIALIVIGVLMGLVVVLGMAWWAMRWYRGWRAKRNQRMEGVQLQRRWEREQEEGKRASEMGDLG
ncbi:MAG: hypothetical protein Q9220_003069 [cf. Caloplaca sp. 1 TL-2023]